MKATKSKDSSSTSNNVGKKERAVTTKPTNSRTKTSSTKAATSTIKPSSCSTSTEKPLPNYLKPTISSLQDSSASVGPKPGLHRKSSFDTKAPHSRALKPNPEKATQQPVRSSSFSSSRAGRGAGPRLSQPLYVKTAKTASGEAFVRKEGPLSDRAAVHHSDCSVKVDGNARDEHDHDHDHNEFQVEVENETKTLQDITTVSEEIAVKNPEGDAHDHDHLGNVDDHSSVGVGEVQYDNNRLESSAVGEEKEEEEVSGDSHEKPVDQEIHNNHDNGNGIVASEEASVVEELVKVEETSEDRLEINKAGNDGGGDGDSNSKELREDDEHVDVVEDNVDGVESGKSEEAKSSLSSEKKAQGSGKKESQIAYNDVIEETASKLLEERKNKVKALVGAFETVIDYESAAK